MEKITKKKMGKMQITIREHFPENKKDMDFIKSTIANFEMNGYRQMYPEEALDVLIPEYQKLKDIQSTGLSYEESISQYIKEYETQMS